MSGGVAVRQEEVIGVHVMLLRIEMGGLGLLCLESRGLLVCSLLKLELGRILYRRVMGGTGTENGVHSQHFTYTTCLR
jgi:hypothetical protein